MGLFIFRGVIIIQLERYFNDYLRSVPIYKGVISERLLLWLFRDDWGRLSHILGVVEEAQKLSRHFPELGGNFLVQAAYLHDVGYAEKLAVTGFHSVDSGLFAAKNGFPSEVVKAVFLHMDSLTNAKLTMPNSRIECFLNSIYSNLTSKEKLLMELLTYCDLHRSSIGDRVSIEERISEIGSKYGSGSVVYKSVLQDLGEFERIRDRINNVLFPV